ncbi:MAG TPA: TlpA disulfide reductase family protein [Myxococcota bacterium]|jgi:thiol-disulfide isomerase/thioredoxin|nr:TlpA disulfide reductase family protein [Myxococcota bacterium]
MGSRTGIALLAAVIFASVVGVLLYTAPPPDPMAAGREAPTFALPSLPDAVPVSLEAQRGRVVLLNFWATWCKPCESEMPSMENLHRELAGQPFTLLAVSVDTDLDAVKAFRDRFGLTFPILYGADGSAGRELAERYDTFRYPESFLIGRDGKVVARFVGPREWDAEGYVARIRRLIDEPAGGAPASKP